MSIRISKEACIGCGKCTEVCPGNLLGLESIQMSSGNTGLSRFQTKTEASVTVQTVVKASATVGQFRAVIRHPEDCWGCTSCVKECPTGAISFYLGADIGGRGTMMSVRRTENGWEWIFKHPGGRTETISVNAKDANHY